MNLSNCLFYLFHNKELPGVFKVLILGAAISITLSVIINFKWKISAHTMAFGCVMGSAILVCMQEAINPIFILSVLFLLAGVQASSRLYLKAHTMGQVSCGFLLGVVCVATTYFLIP